MTVVLSDHAAAEIGAQHQRLGVFTTAGRQWRIPVGYKLPFVVLHKTEALLLAQTAPVLAGLKQTVRRRGLHAQSDFRSPHRENGVADRVSAHNQVERNVVGTAVCEAEQATVVLIKVKPLVAQARVDREPVE